MKVIRCDCGFEASEDGEGELVSRAQEHAREVHGIELPAGLLLALARPEKKKAPLDVPGTLLADGGGRGESV